MKHSDFIIFISIVLTFYLLVHFYILKRIIHFSPAIPSFRNIVIGVMLFLVACYPLARIFHKHAFSHILLFFGSYYLAIMLYAFFLILAIDIILLLNRFLHFFPPSWFLINNSVRLGVFLSLFILIIGTISIGSWNATRLRLKTIKIVIDKPMTQDLVITLFSDVHLGKTIKTDYLDKIIRISNKQHPDIVLIAGDLFDEDVNSIGVAELSASFSKIETRYGVYAVPGNHEYFSGIDNAINLLQQSGIKVLRDKAEKIDERFYLIGRDDRTLQQFRGRRASIAELFQNIDAKLPIILMDHQPFHLEEAVHNAVDLQVSGHTHHGQFFPFNLVTNAMYEKSWGYLKKNHTHFYVSCGAGTWGPPVRIGSTSEILCIEVKGLPE